MSAIKYPDARLRDLLARFDEDEEQLNEIVPLEDLRREIRQYGKRRCDVEASLDNLKYYLGFAFEVNGGLDLDSLALTGLLSVPWSALEKRLDGPISPAETFVEAMRRALEQPQLREWCLAQGTWLQWRRLEAIYRQQTDDFRQSDAFHREGWRKKGITLPQHYLIGEIHRILGTPRPRLATCGEAFEYIAAAGGNPRFWQAPPAPESWWDN